MFSLGTQRQKPWSQSGALPTKSRGLAELVVPLHRTTTLL
jgi:hypothetical protein